MTPVSELLELMMDSSFKGCHNFMLLEELLEM